MPYGKSLTMRRMGAVDTDDRTSTSVHYQTGKAVIKGMRSDEHATGVSDCLHVDRRADDAELIE
jgi:hypothetical protein